MIYLVFTEGYAAPADEDLAVEAIRLGRLLVESMPDADASRWPPGPDAAPARPPGRSSRRRGAGHAGGPGSLPWERRHHRGAGPGGGPVPPVGAPTASRPSWPASTLPRRRRLNGSAAHRRAHDQLLALHRSPVVALNRAVAVGMSDGPHAGLAVLETAAPSSSPMSTSSPRRAAKLLAAPAAPPRPGPSWRGPSSSPRRRPSVVSSVVGVTGQG